MKPLSIYIHIPFCETKCAYCDFPSFDDRADRVDEYVDALCRELVILSNAKNLRCPQTIFLGGGTPSILTNSQISKIFAAIERSFAFAQDDTEITIEANPNSITESKLRHWLSLGINRISVGVQSFDDEVLKVLGRMHTAKQAVNAIKLAFEVGFRNINIDLIHSVPVTGHTVKHPAPLGHPSVSEGSFLGVLSLVTHVSAYSLIIEDGTVFAERFKPISDIQSIKQQKQIERVLKQHGFHKYEVSNFAKRGLECKHNLAYWQPQSHEYIGFGLGAHSFIDGKRFSNTSDFDNYLRLPSQREGCPKGAGCLTVDAIMLGLRTTRGVELSLLKNKSAEIQFLKDLKLIKQKGGFIYATQKGFFVLNLVIDKLT